MVVTEQRQIEALRDTITSLSDELHSLKSLGWADLRGYSEGVNTPGPSLSSLHEIFRPLHKMAVQHPLFISGASLRHGYIFGRGMDYVGIPDSKKKVKRILRENAKVFSSLGYPTANLDLFTSGQYFLVRRLRDDYFFPIPLVQIDGFVTDPDDSSEIWAVERTWNDGVNPSPRSVWIPVARYASDLAGARVPQTDSPTPMSYSTDYTVYIHQGNKLSGWPLAVPDSLGAYVYALAYDGYLQDSAKLIHSLSMFAWRMSTQNSQNVAKAAEIVKDAKRNPENVAGFALDTNGAITSVGVPSAQVNFNNGQPLAAQVAAALGVPVIALISSPGATGGSYGAAQTLDTPTIKRFSALQNNWAQFYDEILADLGAGDDAHVEFPQIDPDANYRQLTGVATAVQNGTLWPDEGRQGVLGATDVTALHSATAYNRAAFKANVLHQIDSSTGSSTGGSTGSSGDVVSGQGKTGQVPGGQQQGDTDHSLDGDRK